MKKPGIIIICVMSFLVACSKEEPSTATTSPQTAAREQSQTVQKQTAMQTTPMQPQIQDQPPAAETEQDVIEEADKAESAVGTTPAPTAMDESYHEASIALARKSGCFACHNIDKKIVGPPWAEVAKRYQGDATAPEMLIEKVKKGGKGNWTEITGGISMPAYSPRVSDTDIEMLIGFILSLS